MDFEIEPDGLDEIHKPQNEMSLFMKYFEILASFYSVEGLRNEAEGVAIVVCALLYAGIFIWRATRYMNKQDAEDLERQRHDENIP